MDTSKLPRLSQTTPAPQAGNTAQDATPTPGVAASLDLDYATPDPNVVAGGPATAWISVLVGIILICITPRLLEYLFAPGSFAAKWQFSDAHGALAYTKTVFFWSDLAIYAFAAVLLLEGAVAMFARKVTLVTVALVLTIAATLFNLGYVAYMMANSSGLQYMSALAVAFGGYIAMTQWHLLRLARRWSKHRKPQGAIRA